MAVKVIEHYKCDDDGIKESQLKLLKRHQYVLREPVTLRGCDIGPCKERWTVPYLASKTPEKEVKVHVSQSPQMDFINKNFAYRSLPFGEFVKRAAGESEDYFFEKGEHYYLRSLGNDVRKDKADIEKDFPDLAADLKIPNLFEKDRFFSSVFRIASPKLQLWTHYDIMDNILIQVQGRKKAVLYSPKDIPYLYLNGDKSEVLDVENPDLDKFPLFQHATPYTAILEPGDILFIPALWFHNVTSLEFGVAVNVFWRHLDDKFYDSKDVYGNKDLLPATRAMQVVDRALKILEEMPDDYKDFYANRLCLKIKSKISENVT